jgi:dihydroorotase
MEEGEIHIDPHVHCRDWEQSYKATIRSVTETARRQGVVAIIDMPNTSPPITTEELVSKRIQTAESEGCGNGYYLFIGATSDPEQLKKATKIVETNPKVVGMKLYAGKSTGDLAVSSEEGQRKVYQTLAEVNYTGVVMLHCEKEELFKPELFNPGKPFSWNLARPPQAEVESVKDQIKFAKEYGVKARLHICHISVPESVELVEKARSELNISCGATPHHLSLSTRDLQAPETIIYKVNPPIRDPDHMKGLRKLLFKEKIDWIETDHAPHTQKEKEAEPYMSGIQSLSSYKSLISDLVMNGMGYDQVHRLTYLNIKKAFRKIIE